MKTNPINILQRENSRKQLIMLLGGLLFITTNAYAGVFDSITTIAKEASQPIGVVIMIVGGMRISNKDIYSGVAAFVGGIVIFKAEEIMNYLK